MRITIEHEGHRIAVENETVVDICEAIDLMEKALFEIGYEPQRIQGAFLIKARQIQESRES